MHQLELMYSHSPETIHGQHLDNIQCCVHINARKTLHEDLKTSLEHIVKKPSTMHQRPLNQQEGAHLGTAWLAIIEPLWKEQLSEWEKVAHGRVQGVWQTSDTLLSLKP